MIPLIVTSLGQKGMDTPKAIYGIIGYPVGHSLSPLLHNTAFEALGVNAEYKLFPLKEDELKDFFAGLKEKTSPIFGLNVTVPYKEKIIEYMDSLSPYAQKARAVNTIVIARDRMLKGFNTDGAGFLSHLTELGIPTAGKRIVLLGAGGTARSIISVLCLLPQRPHSILVYNHHPEKTHQLIQDMGQRMDVGVVRPVASVEDLNIELRDARQGADLLINTTPLGLNKDDPCPVAEGVLHSNLWVYDVIYNPSETLLLKRAKAKGAKTANGLGMLFYQGVLSFEHWADVELDPKVKNKMRERLLKVQGRPGLKRGPK